MAVPYLACMALVAQLYTLPPRVLPSIQAVERGAPGVVSRNANGSEDLGVMQVNSLWIRPLARYTRLDGETVRERLIVRPCFNIAAAGAILRLYLDKAGGRRPNARSRGLSLAHATAARRLHGEGRAGSGPAVRPPGGTIGRADIRPAQGVS